MLNKIPEIIELADEIARPLGFIVVDARLSQDGKRRSLEVSICRKGGRINLSDCEDVSRRLEKVLDEQTPPLIEGAYVLNVQSPGLDRQLKTDREYEIFTGEQVEVKTKEAIPALGVVFTGILVSRDSGRLKIGQPKPFVEQQAKGKKKKAKAAENEVPLPESLELEESKIAQVRLHPGEPAKSDEVSIL